MATKRELKKKIQSLKDKATLLRASAATIRTTDPQAAASKKRRAKIIDERIEELLS